MKTIRKIFVPTDFSETADNALSAALFLAAKLNAHVHLVHFYHLMVPVDSLGQPMFVPEEAEFESEKKLAEEKLAKIKHHAGLRYPHVSVGSEVRLGFLADKLPKLCKIEEPDLLVCGTSGTDKLGEFLWGTHTTSIVGHVDVPVLVVPKTASFRKLNTIVFATDFQFDDVKVITEVVSSMKHFHPLIEVVHMSETEPKEDDTFDWLQEIIEKHAKYPNIVYFDVKGKPSYSLLSDFLKEHHTDLVVLTTKGKNLFERLVSGSISREMMCHSHVPMLVYSIQNHKIG